MERSIFSIIKKILVGLACSILLFGSVAQTVSAEINNENSNNYNIRASGDVVIGTMNKDSHNDNSVNTNNSKNDNRVYDKSINNSEIDSSKNKGATINSHNTKDSHNTTNSHNNVNVTKNGSGQTRANSAGTVTNGRNGNTAGTKGQNSATKQNTVTNKTNAANQNVTVKNNTAKQQAIPQNSTIKNNANNSANVQVNSPKKNTNPQQQNNNTNFRNGGNAKNTSTAQKMPQNNRTTVNNKSTNNYNIKSGGDVVIGEMKKDSHDNNSVNTDNSRNDNRVYNSSINNSKIDTSINKGAVINSHNTENSHNVNNSGNVNIEIKETIKENINHDPQGKVDSIQYKGVNQVYVKGWAYDEDNLNTAVNVEFRVGSEYSETKFTAIANKFYSTQIGNHGFDGIYSVDLSKYVGWQEVFAFAKNIGSAGTDKRIGSGRINIPLIVKGEATVNTFTDDNRKFEVKGWTNTTRVDVYVAGKKLYQVNVNNPNNSQQNFAETFVLTKDYTGILKVEMYAVDGSNVSNNKVIGSGTLHIEDWEYATLPDGWYEVTDAEDSNIGFYVYDKTISESTDVKLSIGSFQVFYLKNSSNNEYFTLKAGLSDYYLDIAASDCAKLTRSNTNRTSHWRLKYEKVKGANNGYFLEAQSSNYNPKKVLSCVRGYFLGLEDAAKSDRWKLVPANAPKPPKADITGSISSIENIDNNQVKIVGKTNMSYLHINIEGTNYEVSLNKINPFLTEQNFEKTVNLKTKLTGNRKVTVYAVDVDEPSRRKEIGSDTVQVKRYDPEGCVQSIGISYNKFVVSGEVYDKDDLNASIEVKGYIYDKSGKLYMEFNTYSNQNTHKFYKEFDIPVPEGHKDDYTVQIKAVNVLGDPKEVSILKPNWNFTIESPIRIINEIRIARDNNNDGIPAKQFVDVYKENQIDKTYFVKYFNCAYIHEKKQGQQIEKWIQKTSVEDFACLKGISVNKWPVYPNADFTADQCATPSKTKVGHDELIYDGETQAIIDRNDTYGTYLIRYYSRKEDYIRKDRWDRQSNYPNVKKMLPNGLWIDLDHLSYED